MPRLAALLLCALAALGVTATPAPEPKPWVTGWDKPVDPEGDCSFQREGDRLTITVAGEGHELDLWNDRFDAPRLLRDVTGDFAVEVRVSGEWWTKENIDGYRGAGILVLGAENTPAVTLGFSGHPPGGGQPKDRWIVSPITRWPGSVALLSARSGPSTHTRKSMYLRLGWQDGLLRMSYSHDGSRWQMLSACPPERKLPPNLKVGVFAESNIEGSFDVVFDKFKLTRPTR